MNPIDKKIKDILKSDLSPDLKNNKLLGRKGLFALAYHEMKEMTPTERVARGKSLNLLRQEVEKLLKVTTLTESTEQFDISAPPATLPIGASHPINQTMDHMVDIFSELGFEVCVGNEAVTDENNFTSLNFPLDHPARDTQDSFILDKSTMMLRTQTSATQVPIMRDKPLPIRVIVPGKVYRREADATHMPMFHQLEGFIVDEMVTFADLKGILISFTEKFFGEQKKMRFRPHYFPFTEPSAEVDIWWEKESGDGRWLEILGCGMIHPQVLLNAGINPKKYQGIAFGLGLERPFMLRHKVDDMRDLYVNKEDFLRSFI